MKRLVLAVVAAVLVLPTWGAAQFSGDVKLPAFVSSSGGGTTYTGTANQIIVTGTVLSTPQDIGTASAVTFGSATISGAAVFNEAGGDSDFRVEGDTDINTLFVDASTDRVGIGTASPSARFHVSGAATASANGRFFNTGTGGNYIDIEGNNGANGLYVGTNGTSADVAGTTANAQFVWGLSNTPLQFGTNNALRWEIAAAGALTANGTTIIAGGAQALSGAGAVNVTALTTLFTSTGAAEALSLANGTAGQLKTIIHVVDGGSGVLTPTTALGFLTITFSAAGDAVWLQYTAQGWVIIGSRGVTIA